MRIKKLDIFGFKSFAHRQTIIFGEGVTAVVGPNGCGKSNVVDALRWVMGEQNPRHLRGGSMQDIIFCGSEKKAPLGFAEVILTIENDKNDAPLEYNHFTEIQIARRLYKTGESEYEINKQKARLKDISDFFLGTGVGTKAYSIIEQGRVNDVISAKPYDRRLIIEEAAGITKYKAKKIAAERRMEACRVNLNRIIDIKNEVDKRLGALGREKEKLLKVTSVKKQITDLDLHMATHRYLAFSAQLSFIRTIKEQLKEALLANERDQAFLEQAFGKVLNEFTEKHEKERLLLELEIQHKTSLELLKKDLEYTRSTFNDNKALVLRLKTQLDEIEIRIADIEKDVERFKSEHDQASQSYKHAQESYAAQKVLGQQVIERRQKQIVDEREGQKKIMEAATRAAQMQAEIKLVRSQEAQRVLDIKNIETDIDKKDHERVSIEERILVLEQEFTLASSKNEELIHKISELKSQHEAAQAQHAAGKKNLQKVQEEHMMTSSRLKSLQEINDGLKWSDSGLVDLVACKEAHLVKGILADVVKAKSGHEDIVEKCLGSMLDAVIVANQKDLFQAISFLKANKSARTSFFLLDQLHDSRGVLKPLGLSSLQDLVTISQADFTSLKYLFSQIYVAQNLEHALMHWPSARMAQATLVSPEGEILLPDGRILIPGSDHGKGVLKRKNELLELKEKLEFLSKHLDSVVAEEKQAAELVATIHKNVQKYADEQRVLHMGLVRLEESIKQKQSEKRAVLSTIENLSQRKDKLCESNHFGEEKVKSLSENWSLALDEHKTFEEDLENIKKSRGAIDQEYEIYVQQIREIEVQKTTFLEKSNHLKNSLEQAQKNITHLESQRVSFNEQIEEKSQDELKLKEHERQVEHKVAVLDKELRTTGQLAEKAKIECAEVDIKKHSLELELAASKEQGQKIRAELHEKELLINNHANEINNLCDRIFERYRLNLLNFLTDFHHQPLDEVSAQKERDDLKKMCDRMGSVNENAGVEYEEFSQRSQFLHAQVNDLNDALHQLEMAIKKINKTTKMRFIEAFNSINQQFSIVFPRLFNGGKAELVLLEDEDVLNCGVEIMAKPPGKNIGSIELMSGGEKALTAISLIMAIFLIKPSPFCLLDEVDAPLDEANVARYSQLIKEMSKLSQFIVITHNRKTMESADQLYGVTMEEAGQSKIVSVEVQKAFDTFRKESPKRGPAQLSLDTL